MELSIQKTKKNSALFKGMASKNMLESIAAREAFAAYITEPIQQIIEAYPALQQFFTPYTYDYGTPSTIPLAPLFDIKNAGFVRVWSQSRPGGLAGSTNVDVSELPVTTAGFEGAMSLPMNFIRAARVDVLAAYLEHMAQNLLVKTELNSAAVLSAMVAQTTYLLRGTATQQVYRTATQGTVIPQDLNAANRIMTRINTANIGGTPAGASRSIDALVGSPEFVECVRNMAFQALNTNNTNGALGGPNSFRENLYNSAGNPSIYGTEIIALNDLGINQAYNILFAAAAGSTTYAGYNNGSAVVFSPGSEQVIFAINRGVKSLAVLSETNPDDGKAFTVMADTQFSPRSEEIGFYAKKREGRVGLDGRGAMAVVF